ncbi:MAG: hypothetical protein KC416_02955, partial [Myxococcales bacterium]|nr:hypothetical protein [Myxococcales bacterium]
MEHPQGETAVVNIAPWGNGASVNGVLVHDNFLDGGNMHVLVDNQGAGISKVRVIRNKMGGR